jgi:predicted Ser/Thr protein kinase
MAAIESIGKYDIRREIGHGAMGVVYEGYDPSIKRVVALKTIRSDQLAGEDPAGVIARFRREAQAAGRLNHPNIVSIYDFGEDDGVWYIAMEFVQGRELKECFESNERFRIADVVRIMTQILNALDYSHRQGVIHRDVKPANIFLLADGSVKVADFGIAHIETSNLTQVGTVLGTPSYMSPEQIMGMPVDGRSDLFSAGVVLYQLLTGERPFTGSSTTTMQKVLRETPLSPSTLNVQLLPAMDQVVHKALAKNADERFQTAQEFAEAIRAAASTGFARVAGGPVGNSDPTLITAAPPALATVAAAASSAGTSVPSAAAPTVVQPALSVAAALAAASSAPRDPVIANGSTGPAAAAGTAAPQPAPSSRGLAVSIVVAAAVIVVGSAAWFVYQRQASQSVAGQSAPAQAAATQPGGTPPPAPAVTAALPPPVSGAAGNPAANPAAPAPTTAPPAPVLSMGENGTLTISAVGLVDPSDPRYQSDQGLLQRDLRADSKSQLVEKAVGLLLDNGSLSKHYDLLHERLSSRSGDYIKTIVRESEPRVGKDGLMSITTEAVVNVKAVQKSLNQMSRDERIDLIRASGDPKVSVQISARDADMRDAPAQTSAVADNILKERIKSFGFRTWSEDGAGTRQPDKAADFAVIGEATVKKLSMQLPASGLTVNKYALTSWTVKCIDRQTGEEIYHNTTLPKGLGSWASEEEALKAIGTRVADEFSRDFFLQHANITGQPVTLAISGMPDTSSEDLIARELVSLPDVIAAAARAPAKPRVFDLQLAGAGSPGDLVSTGVLKPLNAKLGQACFALGAINGMQVSVSFDARCADASVIGRLETYPPAGLYGAPQGRQKSVTRNPETLRKLSI